MAENPEAYMSIAIAASKQGYPAPNPHVGCVIVKDEKIVGRGHHDHAGGPHAEIVALSEAGENASGADVFVTLEPCNHTGRTGPCSEALIRAGVKKVFVAVRDPNPRASGGIELLRGAGIEVEVGTLASQAKVANQVFLTAIDRKRPFVTVKAAVTLDGFMAHEDGSSKWITGEEAREVGHRLRAEMGSVLVGCGTVLADDPRLTARIQGVKNQPKRIVLDPNARLTGTEEVFQDGGETIWVVAEGMKTNTVQLECPMSGTFELDILMDQLFKLGINGVLVEGGPRTIRGFFDANLVDQLELFVSPKLFGSGLRFWEQPMALPNLKLQTAITINQDVHLSYSIGDPLKQD